MEKYCVFAFSSRTESMKFFNMLKRARIAAEITGTPRAVGLGCGLSVRVSVSVFAQAASVMTRGAFATFLGAYELRRSGAGYNVRRILT